MTRMRTIDPEQKARTAKESDPLKAYAAAVRRLSMRMQSAGELLDALVERGYAPDDAEAAVSVLRERGYCNDDLYAEALLRRYRKKSRPAAVAALRAHKLDRETIERAMAGWEPDTESMSAVLESVLRRECPGWEPGQSCPREAMRKAAAKLYRQGFTKQQTDEAFALLRTQAQADDFDETGDEPYEP